MESATDTNPTPDETRRMIFYHPRPIPQAPRVGSEMHVVGTLDGFRRLGFEVTIVSGDSGERIAAMNAVRREIRLGKKFDFLYGSLTTAPIALNDPDHMPRHPFADLQFFRFLRRSGMGVGLFYPDIYWKFEAYRNKVAAFKRLAAIASYRAELRVFKRVVDVLFVPSRLMAGYVPGWESDSRVIELFPGCTPRDTGWPPNEGVLRLFYVGSISPPTYDISPLIAAVVATESVQLTVCCPPAEMDQVEAWPICDRVRVVHGSGAELAPYYESSHIACLIFAEDEYRRFAMPVKLFEYVGMGRPILASACDSAGTFVQSNTLGWSPEPGALVSELGRLATEPDEVFERHQHVVASQEVNSWEVRARQIAMALKQ